MATEIFIFPKNVLYNPAEPEYNNSVMGASPQISYGLVAQLGERTVRIRKVEGSIPFESTNKKATLTGGFLIGTAFARRGSKAGTWRQSGGLSQPAWLFRRKAIPFESTI